MFHNSIQFRIIILNTIISNTQNEEMIFRDLISSVYFGCWSLSWSHSIAIANIPFDYTILAPFSVTIYDVHHR